MLPILGISFDGISWEGRITTVREFLSSVSVLKLTYLEQSCQKQPAAGENHRLLG